MNEQYPCKVGLSASSPSKLPKPRFQGIRNRRSKAKMSVLPTIQNPAESNLDSRETIAFMDRKETAPRAVGRWLGVSGLVLWLSLWIMLILPPFRQGFGRHAVPQIIVQLTLASVLSVAAGFMHSKKWWWLSGFAFGSLALVLLGIHST